MVDWEGENGSGQEGVCELFLCCALCVFHFVSVRYKSEVG